MKDEVRRVKGRTVKKYRLHALRSAPVSREEVMQA